MSQVGSSVATWLNKKIPDSCCNIYKTMNAWSENLCEQHNRTLAKILLTECRLPRERINLVRLLILVAVAKERRKKS